MGPLDPSSFRVDECWNGFFGGLPKNAPPTSAEEAMKYCCSYSHRDECWGPLTQTTMVFSTSLRRFHAFTYFYAVCCFQEALQGGWASDWMLSEIVDDLAPWHGRKPDMAAFDRLMEGEIAYQTQEPPSAEAVRAHLELVAITGGARVEDDLRLCRVEIRNGKLFHCDLDLMPNEEVGTEDPFPASRHTLAVLERQTSTYSLLYPLVKALVILTLTFRMPDVVLYLSEQDVEWRNWSVPVFAISKHVDAPSSIRVPSNYMVSPFMMEMETRATVLLANAPWDQRIDKLYWRGAPTGCWHFADCPADVVPARCPGCRQVSMANFDMQPRFRLALLAGLHPHLMDVKLKEEWIRDSEVRRFFAERGLVYNSAVPLQEMLEESVKYKYVLTIDGAGHANREWVFFLGACQLYHRAQFEAYSTSRGLVPWEHYVPVNADLSDLVERILWARAHPQECQTIAANALRFALRAYSPDIAAIYLREVLGAYSQL